MDISRNNPGLTQDFYLKVNKMVKNIEKRSDKAVQDACITSSDGSIMSSSYGTVILPDGYWKFSNGTIVSPVGVVIHDATTTIDNKIISGYNIEYLISEIKQNKKKLIITNIITGFLIYYHCRIYENLISLL